MQRLLYVSECRIERIYHKAEIAKIIDRSRTNNAELGITGALLFTGDHFAQVLEGPEESIRKLMSDLSVDERHGGIVVADKSPISLRLFPTWTMAYQGQSKFVARRVTRLLDPISAVEKRRAAEWITDLAREFAAI